MLSIIQPPLWRRRRRNCDVVAAPALDPQDFRRAVFKGIASHHCPSHSYMGFDFAQICRSVSEFPGLHAGVARVARPRRHTF